MNKNEFKNPDQTYRNGPFWSWNDILEENELNRQITDMTKKGWSNYFMHSRVGLVTEYLSDKWMELIRSTAEKAGELGVDSWLYDEDRWPSGYAGGKSVQNPDYRCRTLICIKPEEFDKEHDTVLTQYIHGEEKYLICSQIAKLGNLGFRGMCYLDTMNPVAVREFINCTHEKYKESVGDLFGKQIKGIFTDEPGYAFRGGATLQWSGYLPSYFEKLWGYSLLENLPSLFFKVNDWKKIRYHYYNASTKLFVENYTKQYGQWCKENNLIMTGHFMAEDSLAPQTWWIGAAMPHYEYMQWPGIDKLGRNIGANVTVKQLTSATDQLGKERALCEVFGCMGQFASFTERKWIGDWQAILGINFVNPHLTLYSMRGERKRDYPANLSWAQPWWEKERPYADYTARLCYALTQGKRDVKILLIHPISSFWCVAEADRNFEDTSKANITYSEPFVDFTNKLIAENLDFHYGDEILMEKYACVKDGKFIVGEFEYSCVIVPPVLTLSGSTLKLLKEFELCGGKLIFTGLKPVRIDGEEAEVQINAIFAENVDSAINEIKSLFPDNIKILSGDKNIDRLNVHIRNEVDKQIIFLANTDENQGYDCNVQIKTDKEPMIYDLFTGKVLACPYSFSDGWLNIECYFVPVGSLLLVLEEPGKITADLLETAYVESGVEFRKELMKENFLADNIPAEFVPAEFTPVGDNVIVINYVTFSMNGVKIQDDGLCAGLWHEHFYKASEGTPFEAIYSFGCDKIPKGRVFMALEAAYNYGSICVNDSQIILKSDGLDNNTLSKSQDNYFMDISLTKIDISGMIKTGKNEIKITGLKYNNVVAPGCHASVEDFENYKPTEVEPIYIIGDFGAVYENGRPKITIRENKEELHPTFNGKFEYTADIINNNYCQIELKNPVCACAEVFVNGISAGIRYFSPHKFDVKNLFKDGHNEIKAILYPTLFNLTGPTWAKNVLQIPNCSPRAFLDQAQFTDEPVLIKYGMAGFVLYK